MYVCTYVYVCVFVYRSLPDPRKDPTRCRPGSNPSAPSFVCDPDGFLSAGAADSIDLVCVCACVYMCADVFMYV